MDAAVQMEMPAQPSLSFAYLRLTRGVKRAQWEHEGDAVVEAVQGGRPGSEVVREVMREAAKAAGLEEEEMERVVSAVADDDGLVKVRMASVFVHPCS